MDQKTISLEEIKISVIKKILDDMVSSGEISTQEDYDSEYNRLLTKVKASDTVTTLKPQSNKTNYKNFNENIVDLYIDMLTAFGSMNELDQAVNRHKKINESVINALKTQIAKVNDEISNYEQIIKEQWNSDNYIEGFRDIACFEEDNDLYTESNGDILSPSYKASFDKFNECINLPYITNKNVLVHPNGIPFSVAVINKQLGSGLITIKNKQNDIAKAIDTSMDTYWAECILCDTPMRVQMGPYYYNTDFGALCEIELTLESSTVINEISLIPYGPYPIDIISIRYFETNEPDEPIKEIVYPTSPDERLGYQHLSSPISFKFGDRLCKRIRILMNQIHYTKSTFIASTDDTSKNELWFNSTTDVEPDLTGNEIFKPVYLDKSIMDRAWVLFNNSVGNVSQIDITKLLDKNPKMKPVNKYQYVYGFYNIGVYYNDFQDTGIFVSKMIKARSNIKSIILESNDVVPNNCSIEYYVSSALKPTASEWIPITPGEPVEMMEGSSPIVSVDLISGSGSNFYTLSNKPYLHTSMVLNVQITDKDGKLTSQQRQEIENVTNIYAAKDSYKDFDSSKFQYYVDGDKIYFNRDIIEGETIRVEYSHFVTSIRVKAILRRGGIGNNWVTPSINDINVKFNVID